MQKNFPPQISREELTSRLSGPNPPLVIDVLPDEVYEAAHLPGAKNACVFKVTFLDDIKQLAPDRSNLLVLYGSSSRDLACATAAEKLSAAGYTQLVGYQGGLQDWCAAGGPTEGKPAAMKSTSTPTDGSHRIDIQKSRVEWVGRNLLSRHFGTLKLRSGEIEVRDARIDCGKFTVDMDSIENVDIEDSTMRKLLIAHLKSDDFFDVQRFPTAEFQLSKIITLEDAKPGNPNSEVCGTLTLRGMSNDIAFPAIIAPTPDGLLAVDAHLDVDRTRWNVRYASGKLYEKIGKHLVNDEISIGLKLVTLPV
jgi:polyisoprenoid-binding protein YceI